MSGAWLKDTKKFPPNQKILSRRLADRWQNCLPSGKVLGSGAWLEKKSRNTWGSAERCWGCSVVGDWMVLAKSLSKRLTWQFSQFDCHYRICQDKREENIWELCSEGKGQDSSWPGLVFSGAWEIYRSSRGWVLMLSSGPIEKSSH